MGEECRSTVTYPPSSLCNSDDTTSDVSPSLFNSTYFLSTDTCSRFSNYDETTHPSSTDKPNRSNDIGASLKGAGDDFYDEVGSKIHTL